MFGQNVRLPPVLEADREHAVGSGDPEFVVDKAAFEDREGFVEQQGRDLIGQALIGYPGRSARRGSVLPAGQLEIAIKHGIVVEILGLSLAKPYDGHRQA